MTFTKPAWHNNVLRVTGKLTMLEASIEQTKHTIGPRILAVDEAGVQWLLTHSDFSCDMHPYALPVPFRARYRMVHRHKDEIRGTTYHIDADSFEDAITQLHADPDMYVSKRGGGHWECDLKDRRSVTPATGAKPERKW